MRSRWLVGLVFLAGAARAGAQNECTNLGYQVLDNLTATDARGVVHQTICWNPKAAGGQVVIPGGAAVNAGSVNGSVYVDRVRFTTVQSAINAACDGKAPGHVSIPAGTFMGEFAPASNCTIEGVGMGKTIIQAGSGQSSAMVAVKDAKNVTLRGFTVDGGCVWEGTNCTGVEKSFDMVELTNSSWVTIDSVEARNANGNGINVGAGNEEVEVRNSVVYRFGGALPSPGFTGFLVGPWGGRASSHIRFFNNTAHDGNQCFGLFASTVAANTIEDVVYDSNRAYGCANEGFVVYSGGVGTNGAIRGVRFLNNESYCNGWPANGKGFSPNCTPGLMQAGPTASSSGVGFDLNSPMLEQPQIIGNRAHDNYYEGFDNTPQRIGKVDKSGATVAWVSGDAFDVAWKAGQGVRIGDANYLIVAVQGPKNMTVSPAEGTQKGVQFVGVGSDRALFQGNYAYNNGHGNNSVSGNGFADISYGTTYSGNVAYGNNAAGFIDQLSSFVTHSGDKAMDNNRSNGPVRFGFYAQAALSPTYVGVSADNSGTDNSQSTAIMLDAQTSGAYVASGALCNAQGCDAGSTVSDRGKGNTIYGRQRGGP